MIHAGFILNSGSQWILHPDIEGKDAMLAKDIFYAPFPNVNSYSLKATPI
jgi:hypothetical protein